MYNINEMFVSEKKLTSPSTFDTFDKIYTNYDLSVDETYSAGNGYLFDYPTRWLNDPTMNKRSAIRRLDAAPTSNSFTVGILAKVDDALETGNNVPLSEYYEKSISVDIMEYDNLIKVLNYMYNEFIYTNDFSGGGLTFEYSNDTNRLEFEYVNSADNLLSA